MLLAVQLGAGYPELLAALKPVVAQLMADPTVSSQERAGVSERALLFCVCVDRILGIEVLGVNLGTK